MIIIIIIKIIKIIIIIIIITIIVIMMKMIIIMAIMMKVERFIYTYIYIYIYICTPQRCNGGEGGGGREGDLVTEGVVVGVSNEEGLGGEGVRLHIHVCSGDLCDMALLV